MPRPLRIEYEGALYHVTVRGNGRQRLFRDDKDRRSLCRRLALSVKSSGVRLYLYCLMDNHFHLVVETPRANLHRFMQSVLTGFAVAFNLRRGSHGHVTQGRYGARLVDGDQYICKLGRYVHLNPVQVKDWRNRPFAERAAFLREYRWSSYRGYIGADPREEWVTYDPMLSMLEVKDDRAGRAYEEFIEEGLRSPDESFRDDMVRSPRSIGPASFHEWVEQRHQELLAGLDRQEDAAFRAEEACVAPDRVLAVVGTLWGVKPDEWGIQRRDWPVKGVAAWMLEKHAGLTRRACGPLLGIGSGAGVGYQIRKAIALASADPGLARKIARAEARLVGEKRE